MRKKMKTKKAVAFGLSIAMLSSSTGTLAESLENPSTAQETVAEELNLQSEEVSQEETTPTAEISVQTETVSEVTEVVEYPEETSTYPQEVATTAEEPILPEEIMPESTMAETEGESTEATTKSMESSTELVELPTESTEILTSAEMTEEISTEEGSYQETESENESENESEFETETETQTEEFESFEEPETDGYLDDILVEGDFQYIVSEKKAQVVGYLGSDSAITIPSLLGGYPVTTIAKYAFEYVNILTQVTLPKTLKKIEYGAFMETGNLTQITLPEGLETIDGYAFYKSGLTSIVFPKSITKVGDYAFSETGNLTQITLPEGLETIGRYAFYKSGLTSIVFPQSITQVGDYAFCETQLTSVEFLEGNEDTETVLDACVFMDCKNLETIKLSENIVKIGTCLIYGTKIKSVTVPKSVREGASDWTHPSSREGSFANAEYLKEIIFEEGTQTIPVCIAEGAKSVEKIVIPESVTTIGASAFGGTTSLQQITLPKGLKKLEEYAFLESGLTQIELPEGLKVLGAYAFAETSNLSYVKLPEGLIELGSFVFAETSNLSHIELPEGLERIDGFAFSKSAITSIVIPGSVTEVGSCAFQESQITSAEFLEGPEGAEVALGDGVFMDCKKLTTVKLSENTVSLGGCLVYGTKVTSITIPKSVRISTTYYIHGTLYEGPLADTESGYLKEVIFEDGFETIPEYIGKGAQSVEKIVIPEGVTTIEREAFINAKNLKQVTLPKSLKKIENGAFKNASSLPQVELPEGLETIGNSAFYNSGLSSIVIPGTVTKVEESAFQGSKLTSAKFLEGAEDTEVFLERYVFMDSKNLKTVTLSENIVSIGGGLIFGTKVASITIPKSVRESYEAYISDLAHSYGGALANTGYLKEIIFEDGTETITPYIAKGAESIEKIVIPEGVTTIGASAFCDASSLKQVTLPTSVRKIESAAFHNASSLSQINLPEGIEEIDGFDCTSSLTQIELPKSLKVISSYAFYKSGLTSIELPEGLKEIDECAFSESELTSIVIPGTVTCVGGSAFQGSKLTRVEFLEGTGDTELALNRCAFMDCENLETITLPENIVHMGSCLIYGTKVESITVPKSVRESGATSKLHDYYSDDYEGALANIGSLKEIIFEEGMETIPKYMAAGAKSVERAIIPASVTQIEWYAFDNCKNLVIYGTPGSYAETYANLNQIPFQDINAAYPDLYKNGDYVVKVVEKSSKKPISDAKIVIDGKEMGVSDSNGLVTFNCYATPTQKITVTRNGYMGAYYTGMPWSSVSENVVELEFAVNIESTIKSMFKNSNLDETMLYGPQINLFGKEFNLFESRISFKLPWLDNFVVKYDETSQTYQVLIGFKDEHKAELKESEANGPYWTESYQQVKSLVKACGGKVDTTKLWNQFSKLRGKLKSVKGSAAFSANGKITGFIELKYNEGNWTLVDGGVVASLSASANMRVPLYQFFYSEFGLAGSGTGKMVFTLNNQKTYDMSGNVGLSLTPSMAVGVDGLVADVQGGISGTLDCTFSFPAKTMKQALKATLQGKLFLKVSSPIQFFNATVNYDLGGVELYPDFGAYLDFSEWNMAIEDRVVPADGESYEYAHTQTVTLSDGRSVKVYITDDGTKSTGNHTTLMYSIYSNGAWSTPQPVCETGRADVSPILRTDGNKAYVVWLNIGKVISADATEDDIYQNTDLWYSELSGDTFSTPERVPSEGNKKMEFSYDLCVSNGTAAVVWVENSANDPLMQSGNNSIYSRIHQNGSWQSITKMITTFDMIGALHASMSGSSLSVQYSDGTNLYSVSGKVSTEIGTGTSLKIFDGVTYYLKDNQLYSRDESGTEKAMGIFCAENYQVYDGAVYWTQKNNYKSELYMQKITDENVVQLTYDDGYISDFALCKTEDGTVMISYTWQAVNEENADSPYGAAYSKTITGTTVYDLVCSEISYNADEIKTGNSATFYVTIQNRSSNVVNNVRLRAKGKNNTVIYSGVILSSIEAGEEKEVSFTYTLPMSLSGLKLSVEVYSNEIDEADYENNSATCTFAETDLRIENANEKSAVITNQGYTTASAVKVEVRLDNAFGEVIAQTSVGTLVSGSSKTVEYTIPEEYLTFKNASDEKNFYVSVTSDTPESLMSDNYAIVSVEPGHADGITLDKETLSISCGEQRTLTATVTGADAVDRSINWCSSDTDIVTVDQNGTVTGVAIGEADVSAISVDGGYTAICHVTVTEPLALTKLTLSQTTLQLKSGETAVLTFTCEPQISEAQTKLASWTTNNDEVATVKDGTVTAVGEGSAEITVALGGLTAFCQVEVSDPAQTGFSIKEITAPAYNKLKISWSSYEEANGYAIYLMNDDGSYSILKYITDKTILSYVNTVTCGVTYTYKVSPYRLDGKKKVFLTESEPMSAKALPAAPSLQSVNMAAYNKIRITWSKVNGCAGYVIYRSESEDGKYSVLKTVTQASATNYVNVVKTSTTYYYKIRAFVTVNGKKVYGDYSDILSGNVITGPPQNFTIKQAANGKITFTWNKVEDADGYVIYLYYPDTNKYKAIKNVTDIDVLTYGKKMTKGATYHFAMRAYRLVNGVKVYSDYGEIVSTK